MEETEAQLNLTIEKIRRPFRRFRIYCRAQQKNHLGWLGLTMALQAFVLVPVTLLIVMSNGNLFGLWVPVIIAFAVTKICNLTTMPTKIIIPVFYVNIMIDIAVAALSFLL